jgi:hypothetical protein
MALVSAARDVPARDAPALQKPPPLNPAERGIIHLKPKLLWRRFLRAERFP